MASEDLKESRYPKLVRESAPRNGALDHQEPSVAPRSAIAGVTIGLGSYAVMQSSLEAGALGSLNDEISGLGFGMAAALLASVRRASSLCSQDGEERAEATAIISGAGAGAMGGISISSLTEAALLSFIDGGTILGSTLVGVGWGYYRSTRPKPKLCPGLSGGEKHLGDCSERICRECHVLYFPDPAMEDIRTKGPIWLSVFQLVSALQYEGLSCIEAMLLIRGHHEAWDQKRNGADAPVFKRESFVEWLTNNPNKIPEFMGIGEKYDRIHKIEKEINS